MIVVQTAAPHPAGCALDAVAVEPSRFVAYATGCTARSADMLDRMLRQVERMLVPELSRIARCRISRSRS